MDETTEQKPQNSFDCDLRDAKKIIAILLIINGCIDDINWSHLLFGIVLMFSTVKIETKNFKLRL